MIRPDKLTIGQEGCRPLRALPSRCAIPIGAEYLLAVLMQSEEDQQSLLRKLGWPREPGLRSPEVFFLTPQGGGRPAFMSPLDGVSPGAGRSDQFKDEYISTEHLLLALAADDGFAGRFRATRCEPREI
jgi:hypothetical protein